MRGFLKSIYGGIIRLYITAFLLSLLFMGILNRDSNAVYQLAGQQTDSATIESIKQAYALDKPYIFQVILYFNDLSPIGRIDTSRKGISIGTFRGSQWGLKWPWLRESLQSGRPVSEIFLNALPPTLALAVFSIVFASFFGIFLGFRASIRPNPKSERILLFFATTGMALPSFFSAVLIAWIFGFVLHSYTGLTPYGSLWFTDPYSGTRVFSPEHIILPGITLGIRPMSVIFQMTRSSLHDASQLPHVRTARAKGMIERNVFFKHIFRNALVPVFSSMSNWFGSMLAGAVFVEYVFGWNGMGREIMDAVLTRDFVVVIAGVLVITVIFTLLQWITNAVLSIIEPRLR
jgi:peptide/nickel transport system permease protein